MSFDLAVWHEAAPISEQEALSRYEHLCGLESGIDERELRRLSRHNWYAILERSDHRYVQVGYGEKAGARSGRSAGTHTESCRHRRVRAANRRPPPQVGTPR